jgi:hypothetical protein
MFRYFKLYQTSKARPFQKSKNFFLLKNLKKYSQKALADGYNVDVLLLDFTKAFDSFDKIMFKA